MLLKQQHAQVVYSHHKTRELLFWSTRTETSLIACKHAYTPSISSVQKDCHEHNLQSCFPLLDAYENKS